MTMKTTMTPKSSGWLAMVSRVLIFTMLISAFMHQGWYGPKPAEAAITYQAPGALAYGTASVAPAYPASIAAGDLLVLIIGMKPSTANSGSVTTPSGWSAIVSLTGAGGYGTTLGADTGNTNLFTFSRLADGTESGSLTVTLTTSNVAWAQIYRYSKTTGEWSVAGATGSDTSAGNVSIAFGSDPGVTVNDHILGAMCIPTDVTTPAQFSAEAFTQAGMTFAAATEVSEPDSTTGNDIGGFVARTNATAGTATGSPTMTATAGGTTTDVRGPGVFIRIREFAGTPPTAGTVTVSPDSNGYTSSAPAITTTFTDNESPVTSCEYTTNGSAWNAGAVSGTMPTFTCTANPTGLSGALTINMRATSGGGQGTATAMSRTVDTTAPTDGTLTAIAGTGEVGLSWSATDAAEITYRLVRATGATPPADCSGTAIYQGTRTGYSDTSVVNGTQYAYRVCATDFIGNGPSAGSTTTATPTATAGRGKIVSCKNCHDYPPGDGTRSGTTGSFVGDHQKHNFVCATCHVAPATESSADFAHRNGNIEMQATIASGSYSKASPFPQTNTPTTGTCSNVFCHGANNPTPQWGVGTATCVDCHNGSITRTKAAGTLDNVIAEFGLAYGHKKTGRGAVTAADCIVCHLEGNFTTQATSTYHADGNIDLRDPDGAGETPIQKVSSATTFTFTKFATSYAAGSRSSTGHLSDNVDNVLTQKFCLACHDSNGATNTTARTSGGTAFMPWGGVNLGANYTVLNGAAVAGGLIDAKTQFAITNSSAHPVLGPRNKDFPTPARLNAPYNNFTRAGTSGTKTNGVVLNCFDCHTSGTSLTNRTISAHGTNNTAQVRGTFYVNSPTLCIACHAGYTAAPGAIDQHGAGSAMATAIDGGEAMTTQCTNCHSSQLALPARPRPAADYHGFNALPGGGLWPTTNSKPYAFIRSWTGTAYHRPFRGIGELTTGSATCGTGTCPGGGTVGNNQDRTYTPGGSY